MTRNAAVCLAVVLSVVYAPGAKSQVSPLCDVGSSVVELMHFESTGGNARIDPAVLRASLVFLNECPAHVLPAIREFAKRDPGLRDAWIQALRSATRDTANTDVRRLLIGARVRVAGAADRSLKAYLRPVFEDLADDRAVNERSLEPVLERQALATLQVWAKCDGAGCVIASDNLLFLLGTHPIALVKAMRADSVDATKWLSLVADESFAGSPERGKSREAARRSVLKKLSETRAVGFERELRACEGTLRAIRYRPVR
jgi:hypothetical protein